MGRFDLNNYYLQMMEDFTRRSKSQNKKAKAKIPQTPETREQRFRKAVQESTYGFDGRFEFEPWEIYLDETQKMGITLSPKTPILLAIDQNDDVEQAYFHPYLGKNLSKSMQKGLDLRFLGAQEEASSICPQNMGDLQKRFVCGIYTPKTGMNPEIGCMTLEHFKECSPEEYKLYFSKNDK